MKLRPILESIDRKFMPQVHHDDLPKAIKLLQDNGVTVVSKEVMPVDLKCSQKQVNKEKVINIVKDIKKGKKMPPLIVSIDGFIVDGHHRYMAYKTMDKYQFTKVIVICKQKNEAIKLFKQVEGIL